MHGDEVRYVLGRSLEHIPTVISGLPSEELSRLRPSAPTYFCKCTSTLIADPSANGPRVILVLDPSKISSSILSVRRSLDCTLNTILHSLTVATREPLKMLALEGGFSSHVSMMQVGVIMSIPASMMYEGGRDSSGWAVVTGSGPTTAANINDNVIPSMQYRLLLLVFNSNAVDRLLLLVFNSKEVKHY